jgi:serine/threonine protein kinase
VRAFDAGHDGNVYFLVTEYVRGTDLRRFVRSQGALTMEQAASLILQAAVGLQHAHDKGLIHRDVKPGNILVTPDGKAKVSDLGLAGFLMSTAEEDPRKTKIVGTADYISPEQITSPESVTPASDVYSLGCTLYYSITGKVPFPGGTTKDKARRHCEETPWHPRRFNNSVDDEFVDLIADMMEKTPANRVPTAEEVAARLEPWALRAGPMPRQQPTRSPWMPPPLPAGSSDEDDLQVTQEGSYDDLDVDSLSGSRSHLSSIWQGSQTTDGSSSQETQDTRRRKRRRKPLIPMQHETPAEPIQRPRDTSLFLALSIAVPLSMILGALITLLAVLMVAPPN